MVFDPNAEGAISSAPVFDPESLGAVSSDEEAPSISNISPSEGIISPYEYSNPTQYPGFSNLSKQEQLQRIALSGIDPSNLTGTGTFVPPGTYQNPLVRGAYSFLTNLVQPEIGLGESLMGNVISPFVNALSRIGVGTASNLVSQAPDINNLQGLQNIGLGDLRMNSLLEGITAPLRIAGSLSELYHPEQYAIGTANDIRNEFVAAKQLQQQTYQPVFDKYGEDLVTVDPENYLGYNTDQLKYFTPDMKKAYSDFLNEPNFQNLHDFQSQTGKDYAKIATTPNKINTAQTLKDVRDTATAKAQGFLSQDPQALAQYNQGTGITRDLVSPYTATKPLQQLAYGVKQDVGPQNTYNAIKQGSQKIVGTSGENAITAIPSDHPLINHMNDLGNRINIGAAAQEIVPEYIKKILPNISGLVENPFVQNLFYKLSPLYYGGGRTLIGQNANQNAQ